MKKQTKLTSILLVLSLVISFSTVSTYATNDKKESKKTNTKMVVEYYSEEEIQQKAQENVDMLLREEKQLEVENGFTETDDFKVQNSFYYEWPVSYSPNQTITKFEGFELGVVSFDTRGEHVDSTITITYEQGKTVTWVVSGTVAAEKEFLLFKGSISVSVERSSSTSTALGASITKTIMKNSYGYIKVYAHGIYTAGVMKYQWQDVTGGTGYTNKTVNATLPLSRYEKFNIHFGNVVYLIMNGVQQ